MSRSYRKNLVKGFTTAKSEKSFKRQCARSRRRIESNILSQLPVETPDIDDPTIGRFGPKDGKHRFDRENYDESFLKRVRRK